MRNNEQILAEVLDSLIKQDGGRIPREVAELVDVGLRLYNECPDIDPAFMDGLRRRLEAEEAKQRRPSPLAGWPARALRSLPLMPRWGLAVAALSAVLILSSLAALPATRRAAEAGLGRFITMFRSVRVEQSRPQRAIPTRPTGVPQAYATVAEAEEAVGFALRVPTYLPEGLQLECVTVDEEQGLPRATLRYVDLSDAGVPFPGDVRRGMLISEYPVTGTGEPPAVALGIAGGAGKPVRVAGRPALWAEGDWRVGSRWVRREEGGILYLQDGDVFIILSGDYPEGECVRVLGSALR